MPPQLVLLPGMDGTGDLFDPLLSALPPAPPPNLRGLILCASFVRAPHPRLGLARPLANWLPVTLLPRAVLHHLLLGAHGTPALRAALDRAVAQVAPAVMRARLQAVMAADQRAACAGVRLPLLYLQARHDRVVPPAAATLVRQLAPQTLLVDIDAPHCLLQAAPEAAAAAIAGFLRTLDPAPAAGA